MNLLTVAITDAPANKTVTVLPDGTVKKKAPGWPTICSAKTVPVPDLDAMAALLTDIADHTNHLLVQGYVPGTEDGAPFVFMSVGQIAKAVGITKAQAAVGWHTVNGQRVIAKTKANMRPSNWWLLDRDAPDEMPKEWAAWSDAEWVAVIEGLCPGFDSVGYVITHSNTCRVRVNGAPLHSPGRHLWFQAEDAADQQNWGARLHMQALAAGFHFSKKGKTSTIIDRSVINWQTPVYDGKPVADDVGPPIITTRPGGTLDSRRTLALDKPTAARLARELGTRLTVGRDGVASLEVEGVLTLDTVIETEIGVITFRQFLDSGFPKLRCQATFRASTSWNGLIRANPPFLYDNYTGTRYTLQKPRRAAVRPPEWVTLPEGKAAVENALSGLLGTQKRLLIITPPGVGKTAALFNLGVRVDLYVPDHGLSAEMAKQPRTAVIYGRNPNNCGRFAATAGLSTSQTCKRGDEICPEFWICPYANQFRNVPPDTLYLIRAHSYLPTEPSELENMLTLPPPELIAVDEFPRALIDVFTVKSQMAQYGTIEAWFEAVCLKVGHLYQSIAAWVAVNFPRPHITPSMPDSQVRAVNTGHQEREMIAECLAGRKNTVWTVSDELVSVARVKPPRRLSGAPVVFLDATAEPDIYQALVGDIDTVRVDVEHRGRIYQIADRRFSDQSIENTDLADIQAFAKVHNLGVITRKKFAEAFPGCLTFGKLRGQNKLEDHAGVLVLGRMQLPAEEIDRIMRALWPDDDLPLGRELVEYMTALPDGTETPVWDHPDRRGQLIMRAFREAETLQAIGRDRGRQRVVTSFIFNNIPIPEDVTRIDYEDLLGPRRLYQCLEAGPLALFDLHAKFPVLFKTKTAAKQFAWEVKKWLKTAPRPGLSFSEPGVVKAIGFGAQETWPDSQK